MNVTFDKTEDELPKDNLWGELVIRYRSNICRKTPSRPITVGRKAFSCIDGTLRGKANYLSFRIIGTAAVCGGEGKPDPWALFHHTKKQEKAE